MITNILLWANGGISTLYSLGIIKGIDATSFAPYEYFTREQMSVMMYRFAKYIGDFEFYGDELDNIIDELEYLAN